MPEGQEQVNSPEDPQSVIDSFVRPIWYHELLSDKTRELREQTKASLEFALSDHQISLDSLVAVPTGGSRWVLTGNDPGHYQFLFLDKVPSLEDVKETFRQNYVFPRDWEESDEALKHLERSNALKALMITPDEFVVGNIEKAQELRLLALKEGGEKWWNGPDSVEEYVEKKVNTWGERRNPNDTGKIRFEVALKERLEKEDTSERDAWRAAFKERLNARVVPSFATYSAALKSLDGAISCPENRILG